MGTLKCCRLVLTTLACAGLIVPPHLWADTSQQAAPSRTWGPARTPSVQDVALDADGTLRGALLTRQGNPLPRHLVILSRDRHELGQTMSDDQGRFRFPGLRGGVYGLSADGPSQVYRVWTANAAPPKAIPEVVLISGDVVQRGQRPFAELFVADPVVLGVILAAAIAIPVAVHNSRSDKSAS